jgi:hypothetical protein
MKGQFMKASIQAQVSIGDSQEEQGLLTQIEKLAKFRV